MKLNLRRMEGRLAFRGWLSPIIRLDFLILILLAAVQHVPYWIYEIWPRNDSRLNFDLFYFVYNDYFWFEEFPKWLPFGYFGAPLDALHAQNCVSAAALLCIFLGKLFAVRDVLLLYKISVWLRHVMLLTGTYMLAGALFRRKITVFFVSLGMMYSAVWFFPMFLNYQNYYLVPLGFYYLVLFYQRMRPHFLWVSGIVLILSMWGQPGYYLIFYFLLAVIFLAVLLPTRLSLIPRLFEKSAANLGALLLFLVVALVYLGILYDSVQYFASYSPGRHPETLETGRPIFLGGGGDIGGKKFLGFLYPGPSLSDSVSFPPNHTMYAGLLPFLFLLFGLVTVRAALFWAFFSVCVFLVFFSMGEAGWIAPVLYDWFRPIRLFRWIGVIGGIIKPFLFMAAGFGLDVLLERMDQSPKFPVYWKRAGFWILICGLVYLGIFAWCDWVTNREVTVFDGGQMRTSRAYPISWPGLHYFMGGLLGLALIALVLKRPSSAVSAGLLMIVLCGADLGTYQYLAFDKFRAWTAEQSRPLKYVRFYKWKGWRTNSGLPMYRPMFSSVYIFVFNFLQSDPCFFPGSQFYTEAVDKLFRLRLEPLSDRMTRGLDRRPESLPPGDDWFKRTLGCHFPVLRLVSDVVYAVRDTEAEAVVRNIPKTGNAVVIQTGPENHFPGAGMLADEFREGDLNVTRFSANRLEAELEVKNPHGAWLVWADSYHPGWCAYVDGNKVPIAKANIAFKAIRVPSGRHDIRFVFGAGLTGIADRGMVLLGTLFGVFVILVIFRTLFPREPKGKHFSREDRV